MWVKKESEKILLIFHFSKSFLSRMKKLISFFRIIFARSITWFTTVILSTRHILYIFILFYNNFKQNFLLIFEKIPFCLSTSAFSRKLFFDVIFSSPFHLRESSLARHCHISVWILIRPVQKISLFPACSYSACRTFTPYYRVRARVYVVHKRVLCVPSFISHPMHLCNTLGRYLRPASRSFARTPSSSVA